MKLAMESLWRPGMVRGALAHNANLDLVLLVAGLAVVAGTLGFLEIADRVVEGETRSFDEAILRALRNPANLSDPIGGPWVEETIRDLTALGSPAVLVFMTLAVLGYLLILGKTHAMGLVFAATVSGQVLCSTLKAYFARPRPDLVPHLSQAHFSSFPSGHSMLAAVVYLTLGALLARLSRQRALKLYVLAVAMLLTFVVGLSRIYLGVHYPSDVLAGWCAGFSWAVLCWLLARYLQRRGTVEANTG
jgi:undecaprenyl-diphosphatase